MTGACAPITVQKAEARLRRGTGSTDPTRMATCLSAFRSGVSRLGRSEDGFSFIELMVVMLMLTGGIVALLSIFSSSGDLNSQSELNQSAVHRAQREVEKIQSLPFSQIANPSISATSSNPDIPTSRLFAVSGATRFKYDRKNASSSEPIVTAAGGQVSMGPTPFNDGRFSGNVYRFVTWSDDAACQALLSLLCPNSANYKRITAVVEIKGLHNDLKPVWSSTIISDPKDAPLSSVTAPVTECLNAVGSALETCVKALDDTVNSLFLTDTDATASSVRQAITGHHATHPTVAPITGLLCTLLTTSGCPKPDLLGSDPPPSGATLPPLYKYSTDVSATYTGGRVLRRDTTCTGSPSTSDNTKGGFWTTPTLTAPKTLNGKGGVSVYTQTVGGVQASGTLCMAFYDVPASILNLIATPPIEIGRASYTLSSWPRTPSPVSFPVTYRTSNVTIASARRIGVRFWISSASGADIAVIYDHPTYPAQVQLNEPGS